MLEASDGGYERSWEYPGFSQSADLDSPCCLNLKPRIPLSGLPCGGCFVLEEIQLEALARYFPCAENLSHHNAKAPIRNRVSEWDRYLKIICLRRAAMKIVERHICKWEIGCAAYPCKHVGDHCSEELLSSLGTRKVS